VTALAKFAQFAADNSTAVGILAGVVGVLSAAILGLAAAIKIAAFQKQLLNNEFTKGIATMKNAEGQLTLTGKAVVGLGKALAVLALAEGTFAVLNAIGNTAAKTSDQVKRLTVAINEFGKVGETEPAKVVEEFSKLARTIQDEFRLSDVVKEFGRDFQFFSDGVKVNIEASDEAFRKFLDQDPAKAAAIVQALQDQLAVTDPTSRSYKDLKDAVDRYRGAVNLTLAAQGKLNTELSKTSFFEKNSKGLADLKVAHNAEARARLASADSITEWNRTADQLFNKASTGTTATNKLAEAKKKLQEATKGLASATISNRDADERATDALKKLELADQGVTKAKEALAQAIRGYGRDSKEGVAAARSLATAQRDLTKANLAVTDAQNKVVEAQRKLDDLRKKTADPQQVSEAEFGLEKAKLDVEEATLRVGEAEAQLAETLKDPKASPLEKRRAELALVAAKFALRQSIIDQGESERELIAIRATGATAEELAEAERELQDAKLAVEDAIDRQTEAIADLNAEQENYRKITEGIREGDEEFVELSKLVVEAEENQTAASRDLRNAREGAATATDNLRKAEEELRASRKELRVARTGAPGRAFGGPVIGGRPYIVGERGPEMFVPSGSGKIVPNNKMNGGGTVVNVVVNAGVGTSGTQVGQEIVDVLRQYTRVSGPLSQYVEV